MVGASGAVAGVLGAYLITYPRANVHVLVWVIIFFWIVTVPAWLLLGFWFTMQLLSGLGSTASEPGVAFWAHIGGFVAGGGLFLILRAERGRGVAAPAYRDLGERAAGAMPRAMLGAPVPPRQRARFRTPPSAASSLGIGDKVRRSTNHPMK